MRAELSTNHKAKAKVGVKGTKPVSAPARSTTPKIAASKVKPAGAPKRAAAKPKTKPQASAKPAKKVAPKVTQTKTAQAKAPKTAPSKKATAQAKPVRAAAVKNPIISKPVTGKKPVVTTKGKAKTVVKTFATIVSAPPIPPELPRRQFSTSAMRAFDQAIKVFNRRMFEDAMPMFEALLTKFQNEVEIVARSQMYIQVCKQKMVSRPATPRNADELYDRGVFALNIGDFSQARTFFEKALRLKPDEPYLLYSLAATHAQSGAHDQALDYLQRSIQVQPRFRVQAFNDSDFSDLRENKKFLELIGLASPFDRLESRR